MRCLAKSPDDRFPTARAALAALQTAQAEQRLPTPVPGPSPAGDSASHPVLPALGPAPRSLLDWALIVLALLATLLGAIWLGRRLG